MLAKRNIRGGFADDGATGGPNPGAVQELEGTRPQLERPENQGHPSAL